MRKITIEELTDISIQIENERLSDLISYQEFIKYFYNIRNEKINKHHLIIAINFTYGWMPTIFNFKSKNRDINIDLDKALEIINDSKNSLISKIDLEFLKNLFNNSLVGVSKLLHFINPNLYPIIDSRVMRFLKGKEKVYYEEINNIDNYFSYIDICNQLIQEEKFKDLKFKVEKELNYSISNYRVIEFLMFLKGKNQKIK